MSRNETEGEAMKYHSAQSGHGHESACALLNKTLDQALVGFEGEWG